LKILAEHRKIIASPTEAVNQLANLADRLDAARNRLKGKAP